MYLAPVSAVLMSVVQVTRAPGEGAVINFLGGAFQALLERIVHADVGGEAHGEGGLGEVGTDGTRGAEDDQFVLRDVAHDIFSRVKSSNPWKNALVRVPTIGKCFANVPR
jgi:hypothetical protein